MYSLSFCRGRQGRFPADVRQTTASFRPPDGRSGCFRIAGPFRAAALLSSLLAASVGLPAWGAEKPAPSAATKSVRTTTSKPETAAPAQPSLSKAAPAGTADLLALERKVQAVVDRLIAATVGIQLGVTQGSGVIVTRDGYVLTAAHVSMAPGRDVSIILSDGRRVDARSLGLHGSSDAALLKITTPGEYPFAPMSDLKSMAVGDWCLALGHPGGYQPGRPPVLRLGRIVSARGTTLQSDCPLVGGDSGGPLYDLDGNVIGVHSRIGASTVFNLHVSIRAYTDHWDRLAASELIEAKPPAQRVLLGVNGEDDPRGAKLTAIFPKWPADAAGLQAGDVVTQIDGVAVKGFDGLRSEISKKSSGDTVRLRVVRGRQVMELTAILTSLP